MTPRAYARAAILAGVLALAAGWGGCKSAVAPPAETVEAPRTKPRNAHLLALEMVHGKVGTMMYVDRMRGRPAAVKLVQAGYLGDLFDGTGLDPMRDLERVFIASTGITREDRVVIVAQHVLTPAKLRAAVDLLIARSDPPGAWLDDLGLPAARVTLHGHTRVIALVDEEFVAVVPEDLAGQAKKLLGTGGFPDPDGTESVLTVAQEPSRTLRAPRLPSIPETITTARLSLRFQDDGSVDTAADGESTSNEQAVKDAQAMTDEVDRATSLKIAIVRVRFFKAIPFRAEGTHVKAEVHLSPQELDKLMGVAEMLRRQM